MVRELTFPRRLGVGISHWRLSDNMCHLSIVREQLAYKNGQALKFWQVTCKIQQGWNKNLMNNSVLFLSYFRGYPPFGWGLLDTGEEPRGDEITGEELN